MHKNGLAMIVVVLSTPAAAIQHEKASDTRPIVPMPPLGGISPPAGSDLLNMDIMTKPKPDGASGVYQIRSPLSPKEFRRLYASAAKTAGYKISAAVNKVVGIRDDGSSFRLVVYKALSGSSALLTIAPAGSESA